MYELPTLECKRCGYKWHPRYETPPVHCAKCLSPYWDKERTRGIKK